MSAQLAHDAFHAALNATIAGDTGPMHAIWAMEHEVTKLGPFGGMLVGRRAVLGQFDAEAAMGMSGIIVPEDIHMGEGGDMAFSSCVERGVGFRSGDGSPVDVHHRITNVFMREAGEWRIVHHHIDLTAELRSWRGGSSGQHSTRGRIRTCDPWLRRPVLYPLSYARSRGECRHAA